MIRKYAEIFCWKNVSSFCSAKATHIFSAKNIRILYIESAKTVNEMTLNELVKLTCRFEQLGPDFLYKFTYLWQTVQIQISWLLQKPNDLDLQCLQRQDIPKFSRSRANYWDKQVNSENLCPRPIKNLPNQSIGETEECSPKMHSSGGVMLVKE